jgi:alpha-L-rhamnosidase
MKRLRTKWSASTFRLCAMGALLSAMLSAPRATFGQSPDSTPPRNTWTAQWISHPTAPLREPGVFHFRKIIQLSAKPSRFVVHVSADNRFQLFVNNQRVGEGPARGDLSHWRYETFDLASSLRAGENVIAAAVWQFGIYAPLAQVSDRMAFLLEGDTAEEAVLNSDATWQVEQEVGQGPKRPLPEGMWQYWAAGPGEHIDGNSYDWGWKEPGSALNSHWLAAVPAIRESIYPNGSTPASLWTDSSVRWRMVPDPLPPMEYLEIPSGKVIRASLDAVKTFPSSPVVVPPHTTTTILLDHATVISAYPELTLSDGKGSRIEMAFTEALYDAKQQRANRNLIADRAVLGLTDEFLPDGGPRRSFSPLWWRTWRYLELKIETAEEPLRLESLRTFYTAYPFVERGTFQSSDPELARIREICWRTARLDAHETYMDTAVWEQLQYIGDTRLQALISYAVSGDDRLARQALQAFNDSRIPEGPTQSRYPSSLVQLIPPFSLLYVNMLHDYWMYRPDQAFVAQLLPGTRPILAWFLSRQRPDGLLSSLPGWPFIDTPQGVETFPRQDEQGRSSVITLQMIGALQAAAELEQDLGDPVLSERYRNQAKVAAAGVYRLCWNAQLGLLADTPAQDSFSQHANLTAVLLDVIPKPDQAAVMRKVLAESMGSAGNNAPKLAQVSLFYQFYLAPALEHVGMADSYCDLLQRWRNMLVLGLTTTPEYSDPSRSDTHAWSAHPAYDFPTIIAGIHPGSPGFATVRIEPSLGKLLWVEASMPHPKGMILTRYDKHAKSTDASITLPDSVSGTLVWKGTSYPLHSGEQKFQLP